MRPPVWIIHFTFRSTGDAQTLMYLSADKAEAELRYLAANPNDYAEPVMVKYLPVTATKLHGEYDE